MSDEDQEISDVAVNGNYSASAVYREREFGNAILHAAWDATEKEKTLVYTFRVTRKEVAATELPEEMPARYGKEFERYLASTSLGPTGGIAREYAGRITQGKKTNLAMATAIYVWIVETMYRDPEVKGCGLGEVEALHKEPGGEVRGHPLRVRDARPCRRDPRPGGLRNPPAKREGRRYDEGAALLA